MADDLSQKKEVVLNLLAGIEPEARKLESLASELAQPARLTSDIAGPAAEILKQAQPAV